MSETSETSNSDVHLAGQPNFASHPMKWVKSRLLKLDLRSFDWSSASFGHWILVYRHVWVYRSHMRSCCTLSVSFRVASHNATTLEKYLLCVRKKDILQIKPDVYLLSVQLIMKHIHRGLSWAIVAWKLKVSEATRQFWVLSHSKKLSARSVGTRFPVASHHLCTFEGLEVVHRTLTVKQEMARNGSNCLHQVPSVYYVYYASTVETLGPLIPLPMSTLYINHELTHIGTVLHVRRDHDTGLSFSRKMLGIVQA